MKDYFFSPNAGYNQKFRMYLLEKTPKDTNTFLQDVHGQRIDTKSEVEFLDRLILTMSKEKEMSYEHYEKQPHKMSQLIAIVHFTIFIFCQNKNCNSYSPELNKLFSRLFVILMV